MDQAAKNLLDLLDTYGKRLHALLSKLIADRDTAEELLQELFLRVLRSNGLTHAPNPEAYLFRSAINLAFDRRKQLRRQLDRMRYQDEIVEIEVSPLDRIVHQERVEQVLDAMEQLSDEDRELISLRFLREESNEWIAECWGTTSHQIRSRCSKAVSRLRQIIEQKKTSLNVKGEAK